MKDVKDMTSFERYVNNLEKKAKIHLNDFIEMLYIQAMSKPSEENENLIKEIDEGLIYNYLKKRGYSMNYILGRSVMVKAFTCVYVEGDTVEVWHDIKGAKPVYVNESLLTGLPITLNYMERI